MYRALGGGWQIHCGGYPTRPLPPLEPLPSPADEMLSKDEGEIEELPTLPEPPNDENADDEHEIKTHSLAAKL